MSFEGRVFLVLQLILCFICVNRVSSQDGVNIGGLPYCPSNDESGEIKRLVLVSTLDGRLSALNVADGGSETWSLLTGPGPMLSSSIHTLELTNNGQWVRMIPSLSGALYKFNGESIEPIPVSVENLLKSSFRYSEDLVISGGKESRTYGVDLENGRVLYECSMSRCDNLTGAEEAVGDVMLIQRQTQTVRAVEPRSGSERWNFSVGQHEVKIAPNPSADCHNPVDTASSDILLKVIVPDGLVCALSKSTNTVLWKHKFEFPVVNAWQVSNGKLSSVDLFGGAKGPGMEDIPDSPVLYVGMHNKQLYIQESVTLQRKLQSYNSPQFNLLADESNAIPSIPWRPVPASGRALGITGLSEPVLQITDETNSHQTTALSVLYGSEYVNGGGFFLYSAETVKKKQTALCAPEDRFNITITTYQDKEDDEPADDSSEETVQIIIVSMWYWWKEIILLSIGSAIAINILIQRRFIPIMSPPNEFAIKNSGPKESDLSFIQNVNDGNLYTSRYLTDFEPVHCLGKGGFGIVFQAKNKIDDCHYAIKRIPLPNKERARKRVLREVKALAKLDHQNIVRYFNAWIECPPVEWQRQQDAIWAQLYSDEFKSDGVTVDLTGHVTPTSDVSLKNGVKYRKKTNFLKSLWSKATSLYQSESSLEIPSVDPRNLDESYDDSFIVFEGTKEVSNEQSDSSKGGVSFREDNSSVRKSKYLQNRPKSLEIVSDESGGGSIAKIYLYIQMQLCQKDSLREWLSSNTRLRDTKQVHSIFSQIVQAVEYVHLQGLIHRDLKPSNIFFSPDGQIKVGDFGLVTGMVEEGEELGSPMLLTSRSPEEKHTAQVGTQLYMSPEQLAGQQYNYKVDIYSLGLILFELLVPFDTQMERIRLLTQVRSSTFPSEFKTRFPDEYELLCLMLCEEPDKRLTTIGIRSRRPLQEETGNGQESSDSSGLWHFELPQRRRNSSTSKSSSQDS